MLLLQKFVTWLVPSSFDNVLLYNIGCVLYLFKVVSPTALMDAKTLLMNAFDENSDGKIDIAEVSSSSSLMDNGNWKQELFLEANFGDTWIKLRLVTSKTHVVFKHTSRRKKEKV